MFWVPCSSLCWIASVSSKAGLETGASGVSASFPRRLRFVAALFQDFDAVPDGFGHGALPDIVEDFAEAAFLESEAVNGVDVGLAVDAEEILHVAGAKRTELFGVISELHDGEEDGEGEVGVFVDVGVKGVVFVDPAGGVMGEPGFGVGADFGGGLPGVPEVGRRRHGKV